MIANRASDSPRLWRRLHLSTWVLLAVLAVALALIALPGEARSVNGADQFDYGWPLVFRSDSVQWPTFSTVQYRGLSTPPWIHAQSWQWHDDAAWSLTGLLVDAVACVAILTIRAVSFEWWRRRRGRWYQFGLAELLLLITIVAATLGYVVAESLNEDRILAMFQTLRPNSDSNDDEDVFESDSGYQINWDYRLRTDPHTTNVAPRWLAKLVGLDYLSTFERIETFEIDPFSFRDTLPELEKLHHLRNLVLNAGVVVKYIDPEDAKKFDRSRSAANEDATLEPIGKMNRLESLSLRGNFTDAGLAHLHSHSGLKYLDVSGSRVTDLGLRELRKHRPQVTTFPTLKAASASSINDFGGRAVEYRQGFEPQGYFQLVVIKDIEQANFHFERLSDLPQLRELDLRGLKLTSDDLEQIARCHHLVQLTFQKNRYKHLRNGELPPINTEFLLQMTRLEALDLSDTSIGDAGLANLTPLESLENLNLSSTGISSAGLAHLRDLPSLHELRLYHNQIDDDAVRILEQFPRLQILCLNVGQISNAGLAELHRNLPRCHIIVIDE